MATVDVDGSNLYQWTHSLSQLAWSKSIHGNSFRIDHAVNDFKTDATSRR